MKPKRIFSFILSLIMLMCVCGCSSDAQEDTPKKHLTIWAWDDSFNVLAAEKAAERYVDGREDITVEVVLMSQDDINSKLNAAFSFRNYNDLPDIVLIEDYRIRKYLTSYPDEFMCLSGYVDPEHFDSFKVSVMMQGNDIYGVPFDSEVAGLFYRLDLIEQAGYTEDDMQNLTWERFIEIGKMVTEKTGKKMLTLIPTDIGIVRMMMQSCGQWYVCDDGITVNIAENESLNTAFELICEMIDCGIMELVPDTNAYYNAFQNGDVVSVPCGCWLALSVEKGNEDQSGSWRVAPIPRIGSIESSVNAAAHGGASWYVLKNSDMPMLAADFLSKTFASDDNLLNELVLDIDLISAKKSASTGSNYSFESEWFGGQSIYKDFADWSNDVPAVDYGLITYTLEEIVSDALLQVVDGSATIEQALADAQVEAEGIS